MTYETFTELWAKYEEEEFRQFSKIENKRSQRADLHAFLLLDELLPGRTIDMVAGAEHDKIWLEPDAEDLAAVITEDQILELVRCGVMFDGYLSMFV